MKLRIVASAAVGVLIIGFFARPLARMEPLGALSIAAGTLSGAGAVALLCLAFVTGLLAYFASWPYGPQIGVLAVPCGLAIWAGRSGTMAALIQAKAPLTGQEQEKIVATFNQRQALLGALTWESLFWLVVMAAGCAGVLVGRKILSQPSQRQPKKDTGSKLTLCLCSALAVALSGLIAQFTIRVLAQDVEVDSFVAQPATAQIAFAVLAAFALAGFVVKTFLDASYTWPAISSALITGFAAATYAKPRAVEHLLRDWPSVFFSNTLLTILPIQMVVFGTLGALAGYWFAVRCDYWRKHE
jgi:hypothetical protein